jgi:hypothetical protein
MYAFRARVPTIGVTTRTSGQHGVRSLAAFCQARVRMNERTAFEGPNHDRTPHDPRAGIRRHSREVGAELERSLPSFLSTACR